jgi:hypothetical protein
MIKRQLSRIRRCDEQLPHRLAASPTPTAVAATPAAAA